MVFASAATISVGAWALPVYEVYKVGEDVHTKRGLNLFADYGMNLSFVPHWNNAEGGIDLDTSRCFFGIERFEQWRNLLPAENIVVGLDEHSGVILDFEAGCCEVSGVSSVSVLKSDDMKIHPAGAKFPLSELGQFQLPEYRTGNPPRGLGDGVQCANAEVKEDTAARLKSLPCSIKEKPRATAKILPSQTVCVTKSPRWAGRCRMAKRDRNW